MAATEADVTRTDEIAQGIFRISAYVSEVAPPAGFTFNQFLIVANEPLLFHCGPRRMFPAVRDAVSRIIALDQLRWVSFGHVEADECGAMNLWLADAPNAAVVFNALGCDVSLNDLADRPPVARENAEPLDLGGKRVRFIHTPHVPHGWEAQVLYEETTGTLLCGDLFTHLGDVPPITRDDIVGAAAAAEDMFMATSLAPHTAQTLRELARLRPRVLGLMHGSSFVGDGAAALEQLADYYERRKSAACVAHQPSS